LVQFISFAVYALLRCIQSDRNELKSLKWIDRYRSKLRWDRDFKFPPCDRSESPVLTLPYLRGEQAVTPAQR